MSWRLADALGDLREEINARWPGRDKSSDGSIGDTSHSARKSDHNPNSAGVVRAIDVDVDGIPAAWLADHVRKRGKKGDRRLTPGGYVIFNHRIASDVGDWGWRAYTGSNPHTGHVHISVATAASGYDANGDWGVKDGNVGTVRTTRSGLPRVKRGSRTLKLEDPRMSGTDVKYVQRRLGCNPDGFYGPDTEEKVREWQAAKGLEVDGRVGRDTWKALRVKV